MQQGDENDGKLMSESDIRQVRTQQGFSSTEGTEVAVIKEVGTRQGVVLAVYVDVEITQKIDINEKLRQLPSLSGVL